MSDTNETKIDPLTGRSTTGHEWDGIEELNSPLPKWWLYIFYATILWSIGYWIVYPAWPLISGYTTGVIGYSSRASVVKDLDDLKDKRSVKAAALTTKPLADILRDQELLPFAIAQGRAAFGDNCAPCHGSSATGSKSFPNLRDDVWLWGGKVEEIHQTISYGIRNTNDKSRPGNMPPFGGANAVLKRDEIVTVANFVRSLSGLPVAAGTDLTKGKQIFADNCAACHGDAGLGNKDLGSPNLTGKIWLYGSDEATIIETVTLGRGGIMPAWVGRLDDTTIKALAVYVHTLGGGVQP